MSRSAVAQMQRILALIPQCADDRSHSIEAMAARIGLDPKTLLADLQAIAERFDDPGGFVEGVQIFIEADRFELRSTHFLRPMRLTPAEVAALELGLSMLRTERPPEEQATIDAASDRLAAIRTGLARPDADDPIDASGQPAGRWLPALQRAYRARTKVRIVYQKADGSAAVERVFCPYAILPVAARWYAVGYCEAVGALRVFRVDRIIEVTPLDDRYRVPANFALDSVLTDGRVFVAEEAETVRIRYGPAAAKWIAEREGLPLAEDGSTEQTLPLADADWAVRHTLYYGADAEILEPAWLRERMARRLDLLLDALAADR